MARKPAKKPDKAVASTDGSRQAKPSKKAVKRKTPKQKSGEPIAVPRFPIVGLGASAGGLGALGEFFKNMPTQSGMAFVVVMHQAAKHVSLLPELLGKCTEMVVAPIRDRMPVEQGHVYIVPPGKNVDAAPVRNTMTTDLARPTVSLDVDPVARLRSASSEDMPRPISPE